MTEPDMNAERGDGVSRRHFLRVGGLTVAGLSSGALARGATSFANRRAILVLMTGGPSQLETFDPKPDAPSAVRGPFKSIETAVPGVRFSECLPLLAQRANRFAVLRSLSHDAAPVHETGLQLLQTGRLNSRGVVFPHWGSVVACQNPARLLVPSCAIVSGPLSGTGMNGSRGQEAGLLGTEWAPTVVAPDAVIETDAVRRQYGDSEFGRSLLKARQLVESGTRCVTVNLFDSLHGRITWDCHGDSVCGPATLMDYQDRLCPAFDRAMSGLLDDLAQRGLLEDTLVVATGEFGRTPKVNDTLGRDHWPGAWSALIAGGRTVGGTVLGATDSTASEPIDRPIAPSELTATMLAWCGIDVATLTTRVGEADVALLPNAPLTEWWG